jgi:transcription antitermination factor NusA-like protein
MKFLTEIERIKREPILSAPRELAKAGGLFCYGLGKVAETGAVLIAVNCMVTTKEALEELQARETEEIKTETIKINKEEI